MLLQGRKKVSVWLPFPDDDRSNLSILASGHRRDVDVEHELRGPRFDLDMRPGDALFIPPLFPHLVRNYEGGSIAYGVNIISQASGRMMEQVRQLSPYDRAVFAPLPPGRLPGRRVGGELLRGHDRKSPVRLFAARRFCETWFG